VALPAAAARLRSAGLAPWTLLPLGPLWAFEPSEGGGASYDVNEWHVEAIDGELHVSSAGRRATPFARLPTGVRGRIAADGRIVAEA
jgi:hypothetical protein